jgi:hypothetical protein
MKEWGRVKGARARWSDRGSSLCLIGYVFAVRGGVPIKVLAGASGERSGSAAEACIRAGGAHDGIVGHGQVGLNQFIDRVWVMPLVELATWSCPSLTLRRRA